MAAIAGKEAEITAANYDTMAHAWTIDFVTDPLETTNWDDSGEGQAQEDWRTYVAGLNGWSGTFECRADASPATTLLPGSTVAGKFYVDKANTMGYSGNVIITGAHPSVTIEGLAVITFDWTGIVKPTVGNIG